MRKEPTGGICVINIAGDPSRKKEALQDDIYEGFGVVKELIAHTSSQHSEERAISLS
ncbi:MAG TPA: hypothetical protein VM912_07360 [Terriglobales bacterium]|nr:hypothetical protein [Terriglobales bacterium]